MRRAVDIGMVDVAAIKTPGGKIRLRLLFSVEQLEALLVAAHEGGTDDDIDDDADMKRSVTQGNAPDSDSDSDSEKKRKIDDEDDARATPVSTDRIFVIQGTPAWDAWMTFKRRRTGHEWTLTSTKDVDGKSRTGWWFPTLFPPKDSNTEHQERGKQC